LHIAAALGNLKVVKALIQAIETSEQIESLVVLPDNEGKTPLHLAAEYGHEETVEYLLDISSLASTIGDGNKHWPIELSAKQCHLKATQAMIASAVEKDVVRSRALEASSKSGQVLIVEYLLNENLVELNANSRPLFEAASKGHDSVVRTLLRYGADVQAIDEKRQTALHLAAEGGHHSVVQVLLNHYANPDSLDKERDTPLHRAARNGRADAMVLLCDKGAEVDASSRGRKIPLHLAVHSLPAVQVLLARQPNVDITDINGKTPLHIAAERGVERHEVAMILLAAQADIIIEDNKGITPLSIAVRTQDHSVVKDYYAIVKEKRGWDSAVHDAMRIAMKDSSREILRYILEISPQVIKTEDPDANGQKFLHIASNNKTLGILRELLRHGLDLEVSDHNQKRRLHYAAENGYHEYAKLLIESDAVVDQPEENGYTTLHFAAKSGSTETVKVLISAQAETNKQNAWGETPLYLAAAHEEAQVTSFLLEHKEDSWRPVHIAAVDSLECTQLLASNKAEANQLGAFGWTPLFAAASSGKADIFDYLLKLEADPNLVDDKGWTPLHLACSNGWLESSKSLLKAGTVASKENKDSKNCLDYAIENDYDSIVKFLFDDGHFSPSAETLSHCYWEAVSHQSLRAVKFLLEKDSSLLNKRSSENLTWLEVCLLNREEADKGERLALYFLELGAKPFERRENIRITAFQLAIPSRENIRSALMEKCVELASTSFDQRSSDFGFDELRIATELLGDSDLWNKLNPLFQGEQEIRDVHDGDGWNLDSFIGQSNGRVSSETHNTISFDTTKRPTKWIIPELWTPASSSNDPINVHLDGFEVFFLGMYSLSRLKGYVDRHRTFILTFGIVEHEDPFALRADFAFPPKLTDRLPYFEIHFKENVSPEKLVPNDSGSDASGSTPILVIGLCGEFSDLTRAQAGWHAWSVGYHSDDGGIFLQAGESAVSVCDTFKPGSTVGCGVNYETKEFFFTLDGDIVCKNNPVSFVFWSDQNN